MELSHIETDRQCLYRILSAGRPIAVPLYVESAEDRRLCCYDIMEQSQEVSYRRRMAPFLTDIYTNVRAGNLSKFPQGFWTGYQGQVNASICIDHGLRKILGLRFDERNGFIDKRLIPEEGSVFPERGTRLPREFGYEKWEDLWEYLNLRGMLTGISAFRGKTYLALKFTCPWMFDLNSPQRKHLHPWDFYQTRLWEGDEGLQLAKTSITHVLESHLGLEMVPPQDGNVPFKVDARLSSGKLDEFFGSCGYKGWADVKAGPLLFIREIAEDNPPFSREIENVFRFCYPWAFDLGSEEGQHLHSWRAFSRYSWTEPRIIEALQHEAAREGWEDGEIIEKATVDWFCSVGMASPLYDYAGGSRTKLLNLAFSE